jgi:hypothetical protein
MSAARGRSCRLWVTGQALRTYCAVLWPKLRFAQMGRPPFAGRFGCACTAFGGEPAVVIVEVQLCAILSPTTITRICETDGE